MACCNLVGSSSSSSSSSEQSSSASDEEELPNVVLPKTNLEDATNKKRVSFNFALEPKVMPAISSYLDLAECPVRSVDASRPRRKTKAELKEIIEVDLIEHEDKRPIPAKKVNKGKKPQTSKVKKAAIAEKEAKKRQLADEKRAKMEFDAVNKIYKPGEAIKHMHIEMSPRLYQQWYLADVKQELAALGVSVQASPAITDVTVLLWTRDEPRVLTNVDGELQLSSTRRVCDRRLYIIDANDFKEGKPPPRGDTATVVLFGTRELITQNHTPGTPVTKNYIAKAISDLQIEWTVRHQSELVTIDTSSELAMLVVRYTRAIADGPYKKSRRDIDEQAAFYMRGDNKKCVTVDKDGNGLSRLWEQMIATLPLSSLEVARSLGAAYKSPRALAQALQSPDGMSAVAELGVSRTNVPGGKARKLGPEFTRKLHTLFTCEDGNKLIE